MNNGDLLSLFAAQAMALQEEYLKRPQDFAKQKEMEQRFIETKAQVLERMEANNE